jgi:hypothetical protein
VRIGGYPRLWFADGGHLDLDRVVTDADVPEFEARWRAAGCRVEWLRSPHGRLDGVLPQTIERIVRNERTFAWRECKRGY